MKQQQSSAAGVKPRRERPAGRGWASGAVRPRELTRATVSAPPLDELNKAIVKRLQVDGRTPYKEIASGLDVSEGTVRNRVNWMKERGVIRILAVAEPAVIHYRADAMLGVKVAPGVKPSEVAERLAVFPQVVYILWVSGRYDLLVEVVCEADVDFLDFVADHVFEQVDIASIEIMTGLEMFKNQFLLKREFE